MKYDPTGTLLWQKTWGGSGDDFATSVGVGPDGYVYVAGGTSSYGAGWYDAFLLKMDTSGNLIWNRTWGGSSYEIAHDVAFDSAGDILIAAETYSAGTAAVLLKFGTDGTLVSSSAWKGPATYDSAYSLDIDSSGNAVLAGISWDYSVNPEHNTILLIKYDPNGNLLWSENWVGPGEDETWGPKIVRADAEGNIYLLGRTTSFGAGQWDLLLLKLDPSGNLLWSRTWGGTGDDGSSPEVPNVGSLDFNPAGNIEIVAPSNSFLGGPYGAAVLEFDPSGNLIPNSSLVLASAGDLIAQGLTFTPQSSLILAGSSSTAVAQWNPVAGSTTVPTGAIISPSYSVYAAPGTVGIPAVSLGSQVGVLDIGGGGVDVLIASCAAPTPISGADRWCAQGAAPVIPPTQRLPPKSNGSPANNPTSGYVAEPINTGNGNYYYEHTDFSIPARGMRLLFQRYYNAIDNFSGPLGANWNHAYNISLSETSSGIATIRWGDGHGETYTLTGGVYVPQPGVFNMLVANADGTFTLTQKNRTQYVFSSTGRLTNITDKNGNALQLTYDGNGNLVTVAAPGGRSLSLVYDSTGRILTVEDPMGRTEAFSYDDAGNLATATDPAAGVTAYTYDPNHRVTQITLPNGNILLKNAYDSQGRVTSQTNGRGFAWQFAYDTPTIGQTTITDARSAKTVHIYDSSLRIIEILDALGHTTNYAYDANNNRKSVTNQNGNATAFAYDANGNITSVTDPQADTTAFTYDANNNLSTVTNPKGKNTRFTYDSNSNLVGVQDTLGDRTVLAYDSFGDLTGKTDAKRNTTSFSYSVPGDLIRIKDAIGNSAALAYDGDGRLTSVTDPNSHTATSAYDALGRMIRVADALGDQTTFAYDGIGNLLSVTDANGHKTTYSYDATNNLSTVTDALGHITQYSYDGNNNRVGFTNAKGNTTTYQYDSLNRLTGSADPLGDATAYNYDPVGNIVAVTDAKLQTNQFTYDALNRLLSIAYADHKNVAYAYDADGNRMTMVDWTGTTSYNHDDLDRLTSVVFPGNKTVGYTYDSNGRRSSLIYPDGKTVAYGYDADERLSSVTDWLSHDTQYIYDPAGNLMRTQYPNKARIDFAYDPANRLTSVVNTTVGIPPLAFKYTLDSAGNRTVVSEAGIPTTYGYDALNQLTSAQTSFLKTTWAYDPVGNRLRQTSPFGSTDYSYDAADRLLKGGSRSFAYDADGNQISVDDVSRHTHHSFAFDAANRLVAVDERRNSVFTYDGDGNRVSKSVGNHTRGYLNDIDAALPVVLAEMDSDNISSKFVYGLNIIEGFSFSSNDFYQYDGLGSIVDLTDTWGHSEVSYLYDAWGNAVLPAPSTNPFRFAGQSRDAETDLYYLRARYYDTTSGRFLSRDPIVGIAAKPLTANKYIYSLNRPTSLSDPTGLAAEDGHGSIVPPIAPSGPLFGNANSTIVQTDTVGESSVALTIGIIAGGCRVLGYLEAITETASDFIASEALGYIYSSGDSQPVSDVPCYSELPGVGIFFTSVRTAR